MFYDSEVPVVLWGDMREKPEVILVSLEGRAHTLRAKSSREQVPLAGQVVHM